MVVAHNELVICFCYYFLFIFKLTKTKTKIMNRKNCRNRMQRTGIGFATAIFALTGMATQSGAQVTEERTHIFNQYDLKNYAIDKIAPLNFCALAGTIFDPAGGDDNSLHLLVTDNFPGMVGNTIVSKQYDEPGVDERSIGVHYINGDPNDIVIVASRWEYSGNNETNIEIVRTNGAGTLLPTFIVRDPNGDRDMHPMGTLVIGNDLYICGYLTDAGTPVPQYNTPKEVFVTKFDLSGNNVSGTYTWDYNYPSLQYDYDMAVRMKQLSNGNIFVTGSSSAYYTGSTPPPGWDPLSDGYYCATLALILDPNLNLIADRPFSEFRPIYGGWPGPSITAAGEYGNDVVEDPVTGGYFVFGNTYVANYYDPNPDLQFFTVNYLNAQLAPPASLRNRYRGPDFDYAWGIDVVPGNSQNAFVLSGVQTSRNGLSNPPYPTTLDNINPFLAELVPVYSGGTISVGTNYWNTILSNEGTGVVSSFPNSYYTLGGFNSHIAWSPRRTTRGFDWTNDIFLSSPVWNPYGANKLNMKTIRTNQFGQVECPDEGAMPGGVVLNAPQSIPGNMSFFLAEESSHTVIESDFNPDDIVDCASSGIFRPTGITPLQAGAAAITVTPNPAHDAVRIQPEGTYAADAVFSVTLSDITGRQVAELYRGTQAGMSSVALPALTPGLYLVKVTCGAVKLKSSLLSVQ